MKLIFRSELRRVRFYYIKTFFVVFLLQLPKIILKVITIQYNFVSLFYHFCVTSITKNALHVIRIFKKIPHSKSLQKFILQREFSLCLNGLFLLVFAITSLHLLPSSLFCTHFILNHEISFLQLLDLLLENADSMTR